MNIRVLTKCLAGYTLKERKAILVSNPHKINTHY